MIRKTSIPFLPCLVLALGLLSPSLVLAQGKPDYSQLQPKLSGNIPRAVPAFPVSSFPIDTRPMFDYFAWQNFIALNWPSEAQGQGEPYQPNTPSVFGDYSAGRLPVWLRWKSALDLYPQDGSAPPTWDQPNSQTACINVPPNSLLPVVDMVTKFDTLADDLDEAFSGPLPDQTGLFTRFEVRFNRVEYEYVRTNGLYNKANWPTGSQPAISFPASSQDALGSIEVKAAWRDLSKVPAQFHSRFFVLNALGAIPGTCKTVPNTNKMRCQCQPMKLGLVGLHIAHKTADFPQWTWSTFEQVDNLGEDPTTPPGMAPSYFDPDFFKKYPDKAAPNRRANPPNHPGSNRVPGLDDFDPTPVNVVRMSAIPDSPKGQSTVELNARYRQLFKGTVWANYQLIGTQWSTQPSVPPQTPLVDPVSGQQDFGCEDGAPAAAGGVPFPACQVANVTMETYHQYDSCQNCHQGAQRAGADFSWSLANRAFSPPATQASLDALWLDSRSAAAVAGKTVLAQGKVYRVTMQGTYSPWGNNIVPAPKSMQPEPAPMFPSPGKNTNVGLDSEYVFAFPKGSGSDSGAPAPLRNPQIQLSLDGGKTWTHPVNTAAYNTSGDHTYTYLVVGQNNALQVRINDNPTSDNSGRLQILVLPGQ